MSSVLVARSTGVVTVTIDRPSRRNAITGPVVEELLGVFEEIARTPADRAVILTGAGGSFCSGMDLSEPVSPDPLTFMTRVGQLCTIIHDLPRPVIAKVDGPAMGFGCNLALCCDLVVASYNATFGEIFADRGIALDGGASWSLPRLVGIAKAKELVFFGRRVSADEAERIGLINRVVGESEIDDAVRTWAQDLADGPTLALSMMKSALNNSFESSFKRAIDSESLNQAVAFGTTEAKEAGRAFAQKRSPRFRAVEDDLS
ncbi:enoyl-CoA hydratase/isomerase family protein [Nocardia sp. 348MFTsu5.1]|uniref:enoyl-CoA hydratase/isomerase family protein n=1 Tax=Nocardia sp. 348MFTsu5.1 TaxID=1172185 RepID=UPI0003800931|nr:enoyl-CoA hydratase-related protein [Nocardia sp. 348MFTsu5.1]